jgi:hypothetical protein
MLTRVRNALRMIGGKAHTSKMNLLPKLSGAELARSSWAIRIESYNEVSEVYRSFYAPFHPNGRSFPYTVLTPSHERFIHRQPEKLISGFCDEIFVLERSGNAFETRCYPVDGINFIEFKTALLASSLKICGLTSEGVVDSSTFIFNSVTDYLFTPLLKTMRHVPLDSNTPGDNSETEQFNHLVRVNYKFMNYARHSLFGGQKVVYSIFQPEILSNVLTMLGKTYSRTISPAHMVILTDSELILIREDAVRRKEDKYGGIWTYIPLGKVMSLSMSETPDHLLMLVVRLFEKIYFEFLFQPSASSEIKQLLDRFTALTAK